MAETELCLGHADDQEALPGTTASHSQPCRQALIAALVEIDFEYERQRKELSKSSRDVSVKAGMLRRLEEQHRDRRKPYMQRLANVQERVSDEVLQVSNPSTCAFSAKEADILRRLMNGAQAEAIARELNLDERVVTNHIKSMLQKARSTATETMRPVK